MSHSFFYLRSQKIVGTEVQYAGQINPPLQMIMYNCCYRPTDGRQGTSCLQHPRLAIFWRILAIQNFGDRIVLESNFWNQFLESKF